MSRGSKKPRPRNNGSTTACGLRLSVPVALSAASLASAARMRLDGPLVNYAAPRSILSLFDAFRESISCILRELCHIIPGLRQNYLEKYDKILFRILDRKSVV